MTKEKWAAPVLTEIGRRAIQDMRDWLSDCAWANVDYEDFQDMSAPIVARGVSRYFDGGVCAFVEVL